MKAWPTQPIAALGVLVASAAPALAHGGEEITEQTAWSAWDLTPDIVIATALVASVYAAGMVRRRTVKAPAAWWRHAMFFAGLGAVCAALQSPIDPIAEHVFFVHQIQHLLLRMIGPMLLALSWPEGLLTAGLPATVRRTILAPMVTNGAVRRTFGVLAHPAVATALFIAALYFWEIPRYHNLALLNEPVHYLMHVTMLAAGLLFWWRIFDRRAPKSILDFDDGDKRWWQLLHHHESPYGLGHGMRVMMLSLVILSNILLGAYTALKSVELYPAYDVLGRFFGYSALGDEQIGGVIIWIPSSMMCLIAVLIVLHLWGRHETRLVERHSALSRSNSAILLQPTTGAALIERARPKNRAMAIGFGTFVFTVFATTILVGILYDMPGGIGTGVAAHHGMVKHAAHGATFPTLQ